MIYLIIVYWLPITIGFLECNSSISNFRRNHSITQSKKHFDFKSLRHCTHTNVEQTFINNDSSSTSHNK